MNDRYREQPSVATMEMSVSELIDLVERGSLKGLIITLIAHDGRIASCINGTATVEDVQRALLHTVECAREKNGAW